MAINNAALFAAAASNDVGGMIAAAQRGANLLAIGPTTVPYNDLVSARGRPSGGPYASQSTQVMIALGPDAAGTPTVVMATPLHAAYYNKAYTAFEWLLSQNPYLVLYAPADDEAVLFLIEDKFMNSPAAHEASEPVSIVLHYCGAEVRAHPDSAFNLLCGAVEAHDTPVVRQLLSMLPPACLQEHAQTVLHILMKGPVYVTVGDEPDLMLKSAIELIPRDLFRYFLHREDEVRRPARPPTLTGTSGTTKPPRSWRRISASWIPCVSCTPSTPWCSRTRRYSAWRKTTRMPGWLLLCRGNWHGMRWYGTPGATSTCSLW